MMNVAGSHQNTVTIGEKENDKSPFSTIKNNDITGISELHKNQHGSMSSLYQ